MPWQLSSVCSRLLWPRGLFRLSIFADETSFLRVLTRCLKVIDHLSSTIAIAEDAAFLARHPFVDFKRPRLGEVFEAHLLRDHVDFAGARVQIVDVLAAMGFHAGQYVVYTLKRRIVVCMGAISNHK